MKTHEYEGEEFCRVFIDGVPCLKDRNDLWHVQYRRSPLARDQVMIEAKDPNGDWFVALHYKNVLLACDRRDGLSRDYPNETYRVVKLVLGDPEP